MLWSHLNKELSAVHAEVSSSLGMTYLVQGVTPRTSKEAAGAGGPFSWVQLHRRASDASTPDSPVSEAALFQLALSFLVAFFQFPDHLQRCQFER